MPGEREVSPSPRATASKIPVILAVLDGNLVCSYNVYYWHIFNNHPNYGCKSLEYSQNFRSITVSGLPYLMKNPHFDAVALRHHPASRTRASSSVMEPVDRTQHSCHSRCEQQSEEEVETHHDLMTLAVISTSKGTQRRQDSKLKISFANTQHEDQNAPLIGIQEASEEISRHSAHLARITRCKLLRLLRYQCQFTHPKAKNLL